MKPSTALKLQNRSVTCLFVGYSVNHLPDVYRMWDPNTIRTHTTLDIIWLRRMYFTVKFPKYANFLSDEAGKRVTKKKL